MHVNTASLFICLALFMARKETVERLPEPIKLILFPDWPNQDVRGNGVGQIASSWLVKRQQNKCVLTRPTEVRGGMDPGDSDGCHVERGLIYSVPRSQIVSPPRCSQLRRIPSLEIPLLRHLAFLSGKAWCGRPVEKPRFPWERRRNANFKLFKNSRIDKVKFSNDETSYVDSWWMTAIRFSLQ